MAIKECLYSFNDLTFAKTWSETTQKGVFLTVHNHGTMDSPIYDYHSAALARQYYDAFGNHGYGSSNIPILKVRSNQENMIYAKCTFTSGNYRVFYTDSSSLYGGDGQGVWLTSDFNLITGLIPSSSTSYSTTIYSGITSPLGFFLYSNRKLAGFSDNIYVSFNNSQDTPTSNAYSDFRNYGSWPNKNTTIITASNLSYYKVPSGIALTAFLLRENNYADLLASTPTLWFYIDSNIAEPENTLTPILCDSSYVRYKNLNTNEISSVLVDSGSRGDLHINSGDTISVRYKYCNPFASALTFKYAQAFWAGSTMFSGGVGASGTDVAYGDLFDRTASGGIDYITDSIQAGGYKFIDHQTTLETFANNNPFTASDDAIYFINPTDENQWIRYDHNWFSSDDEDYLGIGAIDPRITLINGQPTFSVKINFALPLLVHHTSVISPNEYSLRAYFCGKSDCSKSSNAIEIKNYSLDSTAFSSIGVSSMTNSNPSYSYAYNITAPIGEGYQGFTKVYFDIFTVNNNPSSRFYSKKMAGLDTIPSFEPGNILYGSGEFVVPKSTRYAEKTVQLFNPSFENHTLSLNMTYLSDRTNFTVCFVSGTSCNSSYFVKNFGQTEVQNITIRVIANYATWPTIAVNQNLTVTAKTNDPNAVSNTQSITFPIKITTRTVTLNCSGTKPPNSTWNDGKNGSFIGTYESDQSWNGTTWISLFTKTTAYNLTLGECHFKCSENYYIWNASAGKCDYNPYYYTACGDIPLSNCTEYYTIVNTTLFRSDYIFNYWLDAIPSPVNCTDGCHDCYCKANNGVCTEVQEITNSDTRCIDSNPRYACSGTSCVANSNGAYTSSTCEGDCGKDNHYSCNGPGATCIKDSSGPYTSSYCNNICSSITGNCLIVTQSMTNNCNKTPANIIVTVNRIWTNSTPGPAVNCTAVSCCNSTATLSCVYVAKLSFFSIFQFILAVCIVIIIYSVLRKK